ncbi:hypothetical protein COCNU_06G003050 [Cocos nucifera]|uniref:Uncharacterized protein n=1 Tax=Cocos nucifera TaxID=13894 RepID=A0A8K0N2E4_COCNU|nr:hypothetical protein COCNU_06G003050 [Cocos nucifera]
MAKVVEASSAKVAKAKHEAKAFAQKAEEQVVEIECKSEERLVEARQLAIEAFRAFEDFTWEWASVIEVYKASNELHKEKIAFNQGTYEIGYGAGFDDCQHRVAIQLPKPDLSFLDKDDEDGDVGGGEAFSQKSADVEE